MRYDPYDPLVAPARPTRSLFRLLAGMAIFIVLAIFLSSFWMGFLIGLSGFDGGTPDGLSEVIKGKTPGAVILLLFGFLAYPVALAIALGLAHQRGLLGLIGPIRPALAQGLRVALFLLLLTGVTALVPSGEAYALEPGLVFSQWLTLLPLALLAIFIQISAEELIFRGYLQAHLAARFRHPAVWIGIPACLFGLLHYDVQTYGPNAWIVVVWASLFGVMLGDITARAGTLGPALAIHFINNISAILLAAPQGHLDGLALYQFPFSFHDPEAFRAWMPVEFLYMLCTWLCARLALRR